MPVYLMALVSSSSVNGLNAIILFIVLHLLLYPASNAYNSYQDRDEGSIGMVKNPLPTNKNLFYTSIIFDLSGLIIIALISNWTALLLVFSYVLASRLYSWRKIRLKQYAIIGFLTVFIFQGAIIYSATIFFLGEQWSVYHFQMAAVSSFLFGGAYPLTQVYQHKTDAADGVNTLSMKLGIQGTFIFSGLMFVIGFVGLLLFNDFTFFSINYFWAFIWLIPVIISFLSWQLLCFKKLELANYKNTMQNVLLSSVCMNLCMIHLLILKYNLAISL